jgi:hypothetical protein
LTYCREPCDPFFSSPLFTVFRAEDYSDLANLAIFAGGRSRTAMQSQARGVQYLDRTSVIRMVDLQELRAATFQSGDRFFFRTATFPPCPNVLWALLQSVRLNLLAVADWLWKVA